MFSARVVVAVTATPIQIAQIEQLSFVKEVVPLSHDMVLAADSQTNQPYDNLSSQLTDNTVLSEQLQRMQGDMFANKGIDGKGIRIAVFDGGFHAVNTHAAFKHLRDNGQIVSTWNFTAKNADVFDNHGHGTMVLSCIAGQIGDLQLGLATAATFLLAKTEVDPEPFKEEVWWAQAAEWADKNGADIINSSLGYTKDRHYTCEMDGRSYVARAANMAVQKGILVCNSAGNSGDDTEWKIISTPADAEYVLSVGGIIPSLKSYSHIYFSSYGPTYDGRMKPNVCNYGYCQVADPWNDTASTFAAGTSFSSPLTAGFAACALQTNKNLSSLQLKHEIEQSADLYPYYDYAHGYDVPQACYFTDEKKTSAKEPSFSFKDMNLLVLIQPGSDFYNNSDICPRLMFKLQKSDGTVERYVNLDLEQMSKGMYIAIPKITLLGYTLVAHVNGDTRAYHLSTYDSIRCSQMEPIDFIYYLVDSNDYLHNDIDEYTNRTLKDNYTSNWGVDKKNLFETYFQLGIPIAVNSSQIDNSIAINIGERYLRNIRKWYAFGATLEIAVDDYFYTPDMIDPWDARLGLSSSDFTNVRYKSFELTQLNIELFQRFRLMKGKKFQKKGLFVDMGVFGGLDYNVYSIYYNENQNAAANSVCSIYTNVNGPGNFVFGATARLTYELFGLYLRYRFSPNCDDIPSLQIGAQISF